MKIRKAVTTDIEAIAGIYERILEMEEKGIYTTGWQKGIYPTAETAQAGRKRGDLFVCEDQDRIVGAAVINQVQVDCYEGGNWEYDAPIEQVMVLHTLVIDPLMSGQGYAKAFVEFYESYARERGCFYLRMDTNAKNVRARGLYEYLGYRVVDQVPCVFNGIPDVQLLLIEKKLEA